MTSLLLISAFLALFLSVLVLFKKNKSFSDFLLAFWLIFIAIHTVTEYLQFYNFEHQFPFPWLIGVNISFSAVHTIWIFLYILSFIKPKSNGLKMLWHLVPIVVLNLILLKTFYLKSNTEKILSFNSAIEGKGYLYADQELSIYLIFSIVIAYLIASYWLLRKHKRNVRNHFSNLEGVDLKWLSVLLYCIGIVIIISFSIEWASNSLKIVPPLLGSTIVFIFVGLGIFYIGFHGIRQTAIFSNDLYDDQQRLSQSGLYKGSLQKTENETASAEPLANRKYEQVIQYMQDEKPYLDSDLNLAGLADQLDYRPYFLSQIINQKSGKSFFDFVNSFRIAEVKERMRQPENQIYTLLSIAYDCGFNSKTTFNRVFKNHTGYTPSEFFNNPHLT